MISLDVTPFLVWLLLGMLAGCQNLSKILAIMLWSCWLLARQDSGNRLVLVFAFLLRLSFNCQQSNEQVPLSELSKDLERLYSFPHAMVPFLGLIRPEKMQSNPMPQANYKA